MTLHVQPLSPTNPNDALYLPAITRIHLAAWLTIPLIRAIYYGAPEAYPGYLDSMLERDTEAFRHEGNCRFAVVLDDTLPVDEEVKALEVPRAAGDDVQQQGTRRTAAAAAAAAAKGKVIAAIKYYFIDTPSSSATTIDTAPSEHYPASSSSSTATRTWAPYSHARLASHFWSQLVNARTRLTALLGPHVLVDNLYTDPAHHRRGAGSLLMRHACEEADRRGLPAMLEASPKGIGVYESVGFQRFVPAEGEEESGAGAEIWVDLRRWENGGDKGVEFSEQRLQRDGGRRGDGWYCQVLMVRPAGTAGGSTKIGHQKEVEVEVAEMGKGEAAVI
ncbi:hypothetical protein AYO22_09196 [Fonsecaea multimorphosa]|nr:hypothetical protein AYO22_09196 [Fonsecaea multimorphosa]